MSTLDKRVARCVRVFNNELRKNNLFSRIVIKYMRRKHIPLLSRIAYWIIEKQGGMLDLEFTDLKTNKLNNQNGNNIQS
jgi:hypothetical protein